MSAEEEEERRAIVTRYEQGREKILEEIADWEDPTNESYHVTDRYGFIHDHKLPEKLSKYESQVRGLEISRRDKWIKILSNWSHYERHEAKKLRRRIYKGIPNAVRGSAWCHLLGVERLQREQQGRYRELWTFGKQHSRDVRQIDLDINRTFRNNVMFRERFNPKQQELFRVLVAYSVYNAEIGYCQGMSQLAALLLMFTSEEEAFWCMDRLMSNERYAMHGFFIPGFPKLVRFAKHHEIVLKRFLPKVCKHLKKFDIDPTLYTLKWFFQCFLDRVPFSLTLRLWDCFMLDGEMILTCMSYTLLKLHKKTILARGMEELIHFLQIELEKDFGYHDDQAIEALELSILELKKRAMHVPLEAASDLERPSRPFGILLQTFDTLSIANDDHSVVGSIVLKPSNLDDTVSYAATSRTASEADLNDFDDDADEDASKRKLSVYDNVDLNESIEAAKRLSTKSPTLSSRTPEPSDSSNFNRSSELNGSVRSVGELRRNTDQQPEAIDKETDNRLEPSPTFTSTGEKKEIVPDRPDNPPSAETESLQNGQPKQIQQSTENQQIPLQLPNGEPCKNNGLNGLPATNLQEQSTVAAIDQLEVSVRRNPEEVLSDEPTSPVQVDTLPLKGQLPSPIGRSEPAKSTSPTELCKTDDRSASPADRKPFNRKTSIPKLKSSARPARTPNDACSAKEEPNGRDSPLRSPAHTLPAKPSTSIPVCSTGMSSVPSRKSPTSPLQSPSSPVGGLSGRSGSLIPRLQPKSPATGVPASPTPNRMKFEITPSSCSSPPPPSRLVEVGHLEDRLQQIRSNLADARIQPAEPTKAPDYSDPAKVRIYVPYMKHAGNGSQGSLSKSSHSLHSPVGLARNASPAPSSSTADVDGGAGAEEDNRIRISVASELKAKSYLPRIDT